MNTAYNPKVMDYFLRALKHSNQSVAAFSAVATPGQRLIGQASSGHGVNQLRLLIELDDGGRVRQAGFLVHGCGVAIACAARLCTELVGTQQPQWAEFSADSLINYFALPREKMHCALMAEQALRSLTDAD